MSDRGNGDVVVITGGNEGIGHHMLATLLADGFRVACLDVSGSNLGDLRESSPDRLAYHECDVTVTEEVNAAIDATIDRWGRIDVLVNNAAVLTFAPLEERTLSDTRREFDVNYFGYVRTIRAVLPHMREQGSGIIHNVSSGAGLVGHPGLSGYASTKGAIEALVRSLRLELQHVDIAVTVMHPPLSNTRSAAEIGYPESLLSDPADVGRKLARKIRSTRPTIAADWKTRIGLSLSRRIPYLVRKGTERFVESGAGSSDQERV